MNPKKIAVAFALATLPFLLPGCARYQWVKQYGDPSTFNTDNAACRRIALETAPPTYQQYLDYDVYYDERVIRECRGRGHRRDCYNRVVDRPYVVPSTYAVDVTEEYRNSVYGDCMAQRGWSWERVQDPR